MIFFTSDTHFNHVNILKYGRGKYFKDLEEMNATLIANWNERVAPGDDVYHLGDFAMGQKAEWPKFRDQLNGRITLVSGNHDERPLTKPMYIEACHFDAVLPEIYVDYYQHRFWGAHFPTNHDDHNAERNYERLKPSKPYDIALCGHVHDMWKIAPDGCINVGVDVQSFGPVSAGELVEQWMWSGGKTPAL